MFFSCRAFLPLFLLASSGAAWAQTAPTPVAYSGGTYTQDFNTLTTEGTTLPTGFGLAESGSGANQAYDLGDGSNAAGDTYSFGATGASDRALGSLRSNSVEPVFGLVLRNNTGQTLTQFTLSYTGKQFRLGAVGRADRLDFQYAANTSNLTSGTFLDADGGDFSSLLTTGTVGAVSASKSVSVTVTGLSVANGSDLALRWVDLDVSGADDGLAIDDLSFSTSAVSATPTPTPVPAATALISEFRLSGPDGSNDEYVEIYNNTSAALDLNGWTLFDGSVQGTIPAGKVIPARSHLLVVGSGYKAANSGVAGDVTLSGSLKDDGGVALRNAAGVTVDSVGLIGSSLAEGNGLSAPAAGSQHAFVRLPVNGLPRDTGDNSADFQLVDVNSTSASTSASTSPLLGAPSPENLASTRQFNSGIGFNLIDPSGNASNQVRDMTAAPNAPLGTLSLRRALTNNTGKLLTQLRLHVVSTTSGTPLVATNADVRLLSSTGAAMTVNGMAVPVNKLTLQEPPAQPNGGGLNCALVADVSALSGGGIAAGSTFNVDILLGVAKSGLYRVAFDLEAAAQESGTSTAGDNNSLALGNPSNATALNAAQSNKENLLVTHDAYTLAYQKSAGGPKWVSWHLASSDIGSSGRSDNFAPDPALPDDCKVRSADYSNPSDTQNISYTRGHQTPSGDRTSSSALNTQVFYMSNMLPQIAALNNGPWNDLENYCRSQLSSGSNELYVLSGGIGKRDTLASGLVTVPTSCWKVIVILPTGNGDVGRITTSTRVIAVNIPNEASVAGDDWKSYRTSVDNIEVLTGLNLLANIPDSIENVLEAKTDAQ